MTIAKSPLKTTIFTAPMGWGKTTRAAELMKEFGCKKLHDNELKIGKRGLVPGTLYLTNTHPSSPTLTKYLNQPNVQVISRGWP